MATSTAAPHRHTRAGAHMGPRLIHTGHRSLPVAAHIGTNASVNSRSQCLRSRSRARPLPMRAQSKALRWASCGLARLGAHAAAHVFCPQQSSASDIVPVPLAKIPHVWYLPAATYTRARGRKSRITHLGRALSMRSHIHMPLATMLQACHARTCERATLTRTGVVGTTW